VIIKELFAKLGLDVDKSGFEAADAQIGNLKLKFSAWVGVLTAASVALGVVVSQSLQTADEIDKLSISLGVSSDNLQELAYAAEFSSIDLALLNDGMRQMTGNMKSASGGSEEFAAAFSTLGVKLTDAQGKLRGADEVMMDVAESISKMPDGAEKTALVLKVFGEEAFRFTPLLNKGKDGINALREEARQMGAVMSRESLDSMMNLGKETRRLLSTLATLRNAIALGLVPTLTRLVQGLMSWLKGNRQLLQQRIERFFAAIRVALSGVLFVLDKMWIILTFVTDSWRFFAVVLSAVVLVALHGIHAALLSMIAMYARLGVVAVASAIKTAAAWVVANAPFLLIAAAIALVILLIDDVLTMLDGGDSILGEWLGDDWIAVLKGWRDAFAQFWTWVTNGAAKTWEAIKTGFKRIFGLEETEGKNLGYADDEGRGEGEWKRDAAGQLRFFPYAEGHAAPEDWFNGYNEEKGAGKWSRIGTGELRFFPDDPLAYGREQFGSAATPSGGAGRNDTRSSFNVVQHIQGSGNASPGEIANEGVSQMDAWYERQLFKADAAIDGGGGGR
jgi:hypothetical protein